MENIQLIPIGIISSPLKSLDQCPLQGNEGAPEATVTIHTPYRDAMKGLKVGDPIILLKWLHVANRDVLTCYPRKETHRPHVGVFATRSPDRPNPIGYHEVSIKSILSDDTMIVTPLEALDGTPILDIKPVI